MIKYVRMVQKLLENFEYNLERIPREENDRADTLAKLASAKAVVNNRMIIQETLPTPCAEEIMFLETESTWMSPILHYLKTGNLPQNK